jgi:excisionase family DNA binding protein
MTNTDPLLTVKQLAKREGVAEWKVREWLRFGGLPHYTINGIRIRCSEFKAWLTSRKRVTGAHAVIG